MKSGRSILTLFWIMNSIKDEHSGDGEQKRSLQRRLKNSGRSIILLIAVSFIVMGILGHQPDSVLAKAISICLECVGI